MRDSSEQRDFRKRARRIFWKLILFTLFLIYPGVSSTVMSLFVCKDIGGTPYLLTDFSIRCGDARWRKYVGYGVVMLLIYPLGIPSAFLFFLTRYRTRMEEPGVILQLGFLYEAYEPKLWYFEIMDMGHKLTMVALIGFLPFYMHMPAGMVIVIGFLIVMLVMVPYIRRSDDGFAIFCQVELFHIIFAAYILTLNPKYDEPTNIALSVMMIFLTISIILIAVLMSLRNLHKLVLDHVRKRALALEGRSEDAEFEKVHDAGTPSLGSPRDVEEKEEVGGHGGGDQVDNGQPVAGGQPDAVDEPRMDVAYDPQPQQAQDDYGQTDEADNVSI